LRGATVAVCVERKGEQRAPVRLQTVARPEEFVDVVSICAPLALRAYTM
jgi:hypothetical protein